jgi:hypothetical protein
MNPEKVFFGCAVAPSQACFCPKKFLFPSIPMNETLELLKKWLEGQDLGPDEKYVNLAMVSMELNFFQFNGKFYEQTEGTAMGNVLSSFLANLFMSNFEAELKQQNLLPKVCMGEACRRHILRNQQTKS